MGAGSVEGQYKRRFDEGDQIDGEPINECEPPDLEEERELVKKLGEYEVYRTENRDYELIKGGKEVGWFTKETAEVEEDKVVFELNHDMRLEVSEERMRMIMSPDKAKLCSLVASDGSLILARTYDKERGEYRVVGHRVELHSKDEELIEVFDELVEKIYHRSTGHYKYESGKITSSLYSKEAYLDLKDLGVKTAPYEFRVPREHLDEEGMRAYLRGFFSGDGCVHRKPEQYTIDVHSTCRKGLQEIQEVFKHLGFHPLPIREEPREGCRTLYSFAIPAEEHERFIEEIGSDRPEHKERFEEIKEYRAHLRRHYESR